MSGKVASPIFRSAAMVAVGLILAGCSTVGGSPGEHRESRGGTDGGERDSVPDGQPHITGFITAVTHAPDRQAPDRTILVAENPEGCPKSVGCDTLYLAVAGKTRIFQKAGDSEEVLAPVSAADLQRGQRVHAWHTGVLTKSYPGQGYARVIVIDPTGAAAPGRTATSS